MMKMPLPYLMHYFRMPLKFFVLGEFLSKYIEEDNRGQEFMILVSTLAVGTRQKI